MGYASNERLRRFREHWLQSAGSSPSRGADSVRRCMTAVFLGGLGCRDSSGRSVIWASGVQAGADTSSQVSGFFDIVPQVVKGVSWGSDDESKAYGPGEVEEHRTIYGKHLPNSKRTLWILGSALQATESRFVKGVVHTSRCRWEGDWGGYSEAERAV